MIEVEIRKQQSCLFINSDGSTFRKLIVPKGIYFEFPLFGIWQHKRPSLSDINNNICKDIPVFKIRFRRISETVYEEIIEDG